MALIINPNDPQNMFSKAGKITSEKYIIFARKDEILNRKMGKRIKSQLFEIPIPETQEKEQPTNNNQQAQKTQQPFTKQLSRAVGNYTKIGCDGQPPCGYYNPKFNQLEKANHLVPDYQKTLLKTTPRQNTKRVQSAINFGNRDREPIPEKPVQKRDCFIDMSRQTGRKEVFFGQPTPHEERFNFLNITTQFSKVPRTPQYSMNKSLSREQMTVYKRKHYAPDYEPNFEFGRRKLGSAGPKFDSKKGRDDIMTKKSDYTFEEYFEFDIYSRSQKSQLFRVPTAPNFGKMIDRDHDHKQSILPSYMQNQHTQTRIGITHLSQKMLESNNFSDGRFQTITSSFVPPQKLIVEEEDIK
ncbi:unnamed protein product [Paramecium sonneborni]|uniref:Uncharacterized protein n=1 Tax=Paramecium sonneborni TaxID=65129 RepID=A0A8S1QVE0_9CILI|nr:unnamed protein product [Paramecium sonneborni]